MLIEMLCAYILNEVRQRKKGNRNYWHVKHN